MKGDKRVTGIVAACPFPSSQGSQVLIRQLASALSRRGESVHIITYPFGDLPPDPGYTLHRARSPVRNTKLDPGPSFAKPLLDLTLLLKVISIIERERITVIHGHNYEGILVAWMAGRWLGVPVVYHCHTLMADELPTYASGSAIRSASRLFGSLVDSITSRIPDHVIAVSEEIVAKISAARRKTGGVTYLPPGVDPEEWNGFKKEEKKVSGGPKIVYAGNLAAFQNIPHLLDALRMVRDEFPTVLLEIITPSDPAKVLDLARSMGVDTNISTVVENRFQKIAPRLMGADLACSARTIRSGFPIKHLNYMAAGLPTVCYRSAAKGVVNGETGLVVEDNDVRALSDSILCLLKEMELCRRMGKNARETAFRDYAWDDLAARVQEIHRFL